MQQIDLIKLYRQKKCLVIDDFSDFRGSLRRMLLSFGAEHIDVCENAVDAMRLCKENRYDIILCDYNLGDGKDGQQFLEEARFRRLIPHTALFVMVTAETSRGCVMAALEHEPDGYIAKPFTQVAMRKRLDKMLLQKQALAPINQLIDARRFAEAIKQCNQHVEAEDNLAWWCLKTRVKLNYSEDRISDVKQDCREVLQERPVNWAQLYLGKAHLKEGEYDEAVGQFQQLIAANPNCMEAYDWLAQVYEAQEQWAAAKETIETGLSLSPRHYQRQQHYADLCQRVQDHANRIRAAKDALKLSANSRFEGAENYFRVAESIADAVTEQAVENPSAAIQDAFFYSGQIKKKYGSDPVVQIRNQFLDSELYSGEGNPEKASRCIEEAEALMQDTDISDDQSAQLKVKFARACLACNDQERARKVLADAIAADPDNPLLQQAADGMLDEPVSAEGKAKVAAINKEGIALYKSGKLDEAVTRFQKALALYPKNTVLKLNLVQSLLAQAEAAEETAQAEASMEACHTALASLSGLPSMHQEFSRFQRLKEQAEQWRTLQ